MKFTPESFKKFGLAMLLAVTSSVFLQACNEASGEEGEAAEEELVTVPVEAAEVELSSIAAYYSGTANLEADQRATIVSQTTAVVLEVLAEEGDYRSDPAAPGSHRCRVRRRMLRRVAGRGGGTRGRRRGSSA